MLLLKITAFLGCSERFCCFDSRIFSPGNAICWRLFGRRRPFWHLDHILLFSLEIMTDYHWELQSQPNDISISTVVLFRVDLDRYDLIEMNLSPESWRSLSKSLHVFRVSERESFQSLFFSNTREWWFSPISYGIDITGLSAYQFKIHCFSRR